MKTSLYKPYAVSTEQRQSFLSPESRIPSWEPVYASPLLRIILPPSRLIRTHSKGVEGRSLPPVPGRFSLVVRDGV
jgi:hypothetical protein